MKNILVLLQSLEKAPHIIRYGLGLGAQIKSDLQVVYNIDPSGQGYYPPHADPGTFPGGLTYNEALEKEQKIIYSELKSLINEISTELSAAPNVKLEVDLHPGGTVSSEELSEYDPLFVLLSKTTELGVPEAYYKMKRILKDQSAPVLIVPDNFSFDPRKEIVFASDNHPDDKLILKDLLTRFGNTISTLTLLHVLQDGDEIKDSEKIQHDHQLPNIKQVILKSEDVSESIHQYLEKQPEGLLVLLKQNHNFWEMLFNSSKTKSIIKETNIPVLVYHE